MGRRVRIGEREGRKEAMKEVMKQERIGNRQEISLKKKMERNQRSLQQNHRLDNRNQQHNPHLINPSSCREHGHDNEQEHNHPDRRLDALKYKIRERA